ncbi:MAG TPA: PDZ domain-containing protein [Phycisphaerae bacterium]|nr:PDZ domain-containing protein [Phycisphaerae bacterium]HRW55946.1 PDZ domain-containing protein [Phycisphaerae bacterium]
MKTRWSIASFLLAFAAAPLVLSAAMRTVTTPGDDEKTTEKRVIIKLDAGSVDDGIPVEMVGNADVEIRTIDVSGDPSGNRMVTVVANTLEAPASNIETGGPWLGVKFGPVPRPLASHLRLEEGKGQMILNVLEGSPADIAGFQQYDVITSIDGQESVADMGRFLDQIRDLQPGDIANFAMIRGGSPTNATVTIGTRPDDLSANKYKYEDDTAHVAHGNVFRRGGIMRKDDQGNWVLDALNADKGFQWSGSLDLNDAQFDALLKDVPFGLQRDVTIRSINGEGVRIETDDDGSITVTKETKDGGNTTETTATYQNEAEFERADPDTFSLYNDHTSGVHSFMFSTTPPGPNAPHMLFLNKDGMRMGVDGVMFDDLDGIHERIESLLDKVGSSAEVNIEVRDRIDDALRNADMLGKRLGVVTAKVGVLSDGANSQSRAIIIENGRRTTLEVDAAGRINVTVTEGDNESVEAYDNIDQLKAARPELATKFEGVLRNLTPAKAEEKK